MRVNLIIPDDLLAAIDEQVQRDEYASRSEWLGVVAIANLDRDLKKTVGERPPVGKHKEDGK